jgi:NTP pyrophosphatase (non-canonical NTP hydrolase)
MLDELTDAIVRLRDERDWAQFHSPKNLAMSVSIEAAELMELFQWARDDAEQRAVVDERKEELAEEVADVLIYSLLLCHEAGIDPARAVQDKLRKNEANYPIEHSRGTARRPPRPAV